MYNPIAKKNNFIVSLDLNLKEIQNDLNFINKNKYKLDIDNIPRKKILGISNLLSNEIKKIRFDLMDI